jgi:hypothetical protein
MPADQDQYIIDLLRGRQERLVCFRALQAVLVNGRESVVGGVEGGGEEIAFDKGLDGVKGAGNEGNISE